MNRRVTSHRAQVATVGAAVAVLTWLTVNEFIRSGYQAANGSNDRHVLQVAADTLNVGAVSPGSRCPISITLNNSGSQSVRILKIRPSCTCTEFQLEHEVLAGGQSGELEVVMNAPETPGAFGGTVGVEYAIAEEAECEPVRREFHIAVGGIVVGEECETAD